MAPIRWIKTRGSLRGLAFWLFLLIVVVTPWLYGATTTGAIEGVTGALGVALLFWVLSLFVDRRLPPVPGLLAVIGAIILAQGWWMVANAKAVHDSMFGIFLPVTPLVGRLAGSYDYVLSWAMMLRVSALLGVICLVADMVRRPRWVLRLWITIAVAGVAIALLGLLQKATHAPMIFWRPADPGAHYTSTFFASFYYHANAGAYLNLILPLAAGLSCWSYARGQRIGFPFAAVTAGLVLLGIAANTSRMAQAVGFVLLLGVSWVLLRPILRRAREWDLRSVVIGVTVLAVAIFAVAQASRLDQPLHRWSQLSDHLPADQRWAADRAALGATSTAGLFGFGPGTFRAIFPHFQQAMSGELKGVWRFLHNDYLQTVLEWGWLGSLAFGALFFGGIGAGLRNYFKAEDWSHRQRLLLLSCVLALGGVAIHAVVDFPLQICSIQLLVATYVGICWGTGSWKVERLK